MDELRSCAAQDWRYQLKDGFPQRKNAALFDLTHKAKADPRALQSTQHTGSICLLQSYAAGFFSNPVVFGLAF